MMKVKKKEAFERTKIVVRHLPPSLSQSVLFSQFDHLFSHRYNWVCFCPCKSSSKHQRYSRAYIDFKSPDDVLEFAEFFNGHVFVNEKGAQFKANIEYAPSQRVPKPCARKDSREGNIYKDPDYLEFLKHIAKPVENRPSFKIQLESKAEQSGAAKETPISTPLMEYVRQKRAAEGGTQDSLAVVKVSKRAGSASLNRRSSSTTKRGSDKKMHIPKGSAKKSNKKDKSVVIVAPRKENEPTNSSRKKIPGIQSFSASEESVSKVTMSADCGRKKILLVKGKEQENFLVSEGLLQRSVHTSPVGNSPVFAASKQNQQCKASERLIRSILLNNEACENQSSQPVQSQQKFRNLNLKSNKRATQPTNTQVGLNDQVPCSEPSPFISDGDAKRTSDEKFKKKDLHSSVAACERQEKHTRIKDRPDRGVWTPFQRFEFQHTEENLSSTIFQQLHSDSIGDDMHNWNRSREAAGLSNGSHSSSGENGLHRRGKPTATYNVKGNSYLNTARGKSSKKASATGYSAHEKQVWVQKASSGS